MKCVHGGATTIYGRPEKSYRNPSRITNLYNEIWSDITEELDSKIHITLV